MKKVFISILMFLPLMVSAQNVLTPQQQLEQAQKQLEEAKKAVEAAKVEAEKAKVEAELAKVAAEKAKAEAEKKKAEIEKAKADADKAKADSEKTKAEAEKTGADLKPSIANEPVTLPAIGGKPVVASPEENGNKQSDKELNKSNNGGWVVPTTPVAKKETKVEKKLSDGTKLKVDPKYLEGAIPTNANGKVEFELSTDANGKSAKQIYDIVYQYFTELTQDKNNIASRVALVNEKEFTIANTMDEWLVFSQSFISLDRSEFRYQLVATIADNSLKVSLSRILYNYEEDRSTGFKEPAENVIVDKIALNKKKNNLAKIFGKFRRATIDRKDQIFNDIVTLVKQ